MVGAQLEVPVVVGWLVDLLLLQRFLLFRMGICFFLFFVVSWKINEPRKYNHVHIERFWCLAFQLVVSGLKYDGFCDDLI